MLKNIGSFLTKKSVWWLLGLFGSSGILTMLGILLLFIMIIGISGGSSAEQSLAEDVGAGNVYYCHPIQDDVDQVLWDAVFENESSSGKLYGYGDKIIELSDEKGIDPVLFAAIAMHETNWGKSDAIKNYNNPGGLMNATGLMVFDTLDDGLESMARTLHNRIIIDGLITIEQLGAVYAPVGAWNDPYDMNVHWVPTTEQIVNQFGGLTKDCGRIDRVGFEFLDEEVSEIRATIAEAGVALIGNSEYVFGGGRNQSDIAKGYFDCSSFVHWAFNQGGIDLGNVTSTSTETLNKLGSKIDIDDVQVGDLVFWDTYKIDGHVGIYVGNGQFIGAQSSTGVAIEYLSNPYWSGVFSGHVRRIVE